MAFAYPSAICGLGRSPYGPLQPRRKMTPFATYEICLVHLLRLKAELPGPVDQVFYR